MNHQSFLGIELPIIQAPMAGVQDSTLTIAVSSAGGLGSLACAMLDTNTLRKELDTLKKATSKVFNLNFFCHQDADPNAEQEQLWRKKLSPYFDEYGINPNTITKGAKRAPFSHAIADVLDDCPPKIISFHFGLPKDDLLARVKAWGCLVLSSATTVEEALWLEAHGADGIIAQGVEAGGHRGMFLNDDLNSQLGTFALLPQVVNAVNIPVIAAGGIADAQSVKAALTLGAIAVQVGTSYLLCHEANTSPIHRAALSSDQAQHTALTNVFTGKPARSIVNRVINEVGPLSAHTPNFPYAATAITALRAAAEKAHSGAFTPLWCGQNATGCQAISAAELTHSLASEIV